MIVMVDAGCPDPRRMPGFPRPTRKCENDGVSKLARTALLVLLVGIAETAGAEVLKIVVDDLIHPITDEFIARALAQAKARRDDALLIVLRTPGGLETSARSIVQRIIASPVPVIIYVSPSGSRAASAGFFLLQAADIAAMAPGTNTGAAHPVTLGGEKIEEIMKQKMENDAAAFIRTIVAKRGRNVEAAEAAVRSSKSYTEQEALGLRVIDLVAPSEAVLLREIDGKSFRRFDGRAVKLALGSRKVRVLEMTLKQKVLSFIMDPNVAFILLSLGMLALWAEFNHPGAILPGVTGLISILLAIFALNILPTRFAAIVLIAAAFLLFALEAKFVSHGVFGIGGVVVMVIGALLLVDGPIPEMRVSLGTALAVSVPIGLIAVFLTMLVLKSRAHPVMTGLEGMIGEIGEARTALDPAGQVFVHGEIWNARALVPVESGSAVRVTSVHDLMLEVAPADQGREPA